MLLDLPRYALRLLRRIAKQVLLRCEERCSALLCGWRFGANHIERPPDKVSLASMFILPPPKSGREAHAAKPLPRARRGTGHFSFGSPAVEGLASAFPRNQKPFGPTHQHINAKSDDADQDDSHNYDVGVLEL